MPQFSDQTPPRAPVELASRGTDAHGEAIAALDVLHKTLRRSIDAETGVDIGVIEDRIAEVKALFTPDPGSEATAAAPIDEPRRHRLFHRLFVVRFEDLLSGSPEATNPPMLPRICLDPLLQAFQAISQASLWDMGQQLALQRFQDATATTPEDPWSCLLTDRPLNGIVDQILADMAVMLQAGDLRFAWVREFVLPRLPDPHDQHARTNPDAYLSADLYHRLLAHLYTPFINQYRCSGAQASRAQWAMDFPPVTADALVRLVGNLDPENPEC